MAEQINGKITHTLEDKWHSLTPEQRAQHTLENSELYQFVTRARLMTQQINEMNKNVDEEFQVRIPTFYDWNIVTDPNK